MKIKELISTPVSFLGIVIGLSIIISTLVAGSIFYRVRAFDNALSVTGSAKKEVISDTVKWTGMISRTAKIATLKVGYANMAKDLSAVKAFLAAKGIPEDAITITPIFMNEIYNQYGNANDKDYTLTQNIEINSSDVEKISNLAKNTESLISEGTVFSTTGLEYYYSKLPEVRVELLSDALKDAESRAAELAQSSGKKVGGLKAASSGVVQVLSQNSTEVSDYGSYNTSSINKEIMVTVKASFLLK